MTYAFTFDASACSGCKACQVACKDKNNLPVGVLWRRVYEVSGGTWIKQNDAWTTDVFAYNLSIACNHCVHPKCAGVCPTDAYVQREDGIVYIDESKCIGCGYCNWACPYGVPQYNPELGHMTKCNFCMDNLDAGLPPACVAACPMRVLDFVAVDTSPSLTPSRCPTGSTGDGLWTMDSKKSLWLLPASEHPFPLPNNSRTEPHLAVKPHTGMLNSLEKTVANHEETKLARVKSELPLVAFTLLGQAAAGIAIWSFFFGPLSFPVLIATGLLIGLGGLASLLHLGAPRNAWRAVIHLRKSWLSREILMFGLFAGSWLIAFAFPGMGKLPFTICGFGLVYSMSMVYRLRSIRAWDTWRTTAGFFITALLVGLLFVLWLMGKGRLSSLQIWGVILLLGIQLVFQRLGIDDAHKMGNSLRLGLIAVGVLGSLILLLLPTFFQLWALFLVIPFVLAEEILGRWLFYEHIHQRVL